MSAIYNFNELNIEKTYEDAIEINEIRYKLIKEIKLKDVEIFENVLQNKGITDYYFIRTDNKNIEIFVSYFQFDKVLGFLEDELLNKKMELKEYKYRHYRQVKNREDIKSITVSSVRKKSVVLQNFEDISKTEVIGKVLKKVLFIILWLNAGFLLVPLFKTGNFIPKFQIFMNIFFVPIILALALIEIFDVDKRKFKIKNDFDRIIINDREEILHNDIIKVSIIAYVQILTKECFHNPNVKWRPFFHGIGYGKFEARNVLNIEYNKGYTIKKKKFQLRYVNKERLEEFLNLFKEEA